MSSLLFISNFYVLFIIPTLFLIWRNIQQRRETIILDCGKEGLRSLFFFIAGFATALYTVALWSTVEHLIDTASFKLTSFFYFHMLLLASHGTLKHQITQAGIFFPFYKMKWGEIKNYQWIEKEKGYILAGNLHNPTLLNQRFAFSISKDQKEAVDRLIKEHAINLEPSSQS